MAAVLGVLSVALLGASFRWAHHWGPLADHRRRVGCGNAGRALEGVAFAAGMSPAGACAGG